MLLRVTYRVWNGECPAAAAAAARLHALRRLNLYAWYKLGGNLLSRCHGTMYLRVPRLFAARICLTSPLPHVPSSIIETARGWGCGSKASACRCSQLQSHDGHVHWRWPYCVDSFQDLLLIHWPGASKTKPTDPANAQLRLESWRVLEELHE